MTSFKSNENIHKKEDGSYYVISAMAVFKGKSLSGRSKISKLRISLKIYSEYMIFIFKELK